MNFLVLLTDGFGGHGGIAKFNRDFLNALCAAPAVKAVRALPRLVPQPNEVNGLPAKLTHDISGLGGKWNYFRAIIRAARAMRYKNQSAIHTPKSAIVCAHLNLLPLAWLASRITRARLIVNIHGIDAWTPHRSWLVRKMISRVDAFITVSHFTRRKFLGWARTKALFYLLPNCVDLAAFGRGGKNPALLDRLGLRGRTVIMTLARLSAAERYKGIDEVLEAMPELAQKIPNIAYLICGDGDDRPRLMEKARSLNFDVVDVSFPLSTFSFHPDRPLVVFTGKIPEEQKADHYRLADAFVMAGWGEGFGIAYLEALACGVPVVGSVLDASQEALLHGQLGELVNPKDRADLVAGILRALATPRREFTALETFSADRFSQRVAEIVQQFGSAQKSAVTQPSTLNPQPTSCPRATN